MGNIYAPVNTLRTRPFSVCLLPILHKRAGLCVRKYQYKIHKLLSAEGNHAHIHTYVGLPVSMLDYCYNNYVKLIKNNNNSSGNMIMSTVEMLVTRYHNVVKRTLLYVKFCFVLSVKQFRALCYTGNCITQDMQVAGFSSHL